MRPVYENRTVSVQVTVVKLIERLWLGGTWLAQISQHLIRGSRTPVLHFYFFIQGPGLPQVGLAVISTNETEELHSRGLVCLLLQRICIQ
jgi:hypothetical protein